MQVTTVSNELDHTILVLLDEHAYDRAAALLFEAHKKASADGEIALASSLLAAHQICATCHQQHQERELHYQAYEDSILRERVLQDQLHGLLKSLTAVTLPAQESRVNVEYGSSEAKEVSVWQRVQQNVRAVIGDIWKKRPFFSNIPPTGQTDRSIRNSEAESLDQLFSNRLLERQAEPHAESNKGANSPQTTSEIFLVVPNKPSLAIYCLGIFQVYEDDHFIQDWSNGKGKSIFKYLVANRHQPVNKEVLMETFWPDAAPDAARNNLNVAIYGLRQALRNGYPDFSHVLYRDDAYLLNPEMNLWIDFEAFEQRVKNAKKLDNRNLSEQALQEYHAAEELVQGEFLMEDRYDDWLFATRERLQETYLDVLSRLSDYYFKTQNYAACVLHCQKYLVIEPCREATHRQLMRAYFHQNQHYLSLRQYYKCMENLKRDLDVAPQARTTQLYQSIRMGKMIDS